MSSIKRGCGEPILLISESYHSADMYYATGFLAPDRFVYICQDDSEYLFVSQMEYERAKKQSKVKNVHSMEEYDYLNRLRSLKDPDLALVDTLVAIFSSINIKKVRVPADFSLLLGDLLRSKGITVVPTPRLFEEARSVKTPDELEKIKKAQAVNEKAMAHAIEIIKKSQPVNGVLYYEGRPLTSELLQREIEMVFIANGYDTNDSIVAAGPRSSDPHFAGEGHVKENEPIVIDLFPYGKKDRYYADMTRTVVMGRPSAEIQKMYDVTLEAQNIALKAIKAGITGKYVNDLVCECFEKHGYGTTRTKSAEGFIHSTGHGVGIDIHELPSISESGLEPLKAGQVVTVEPGLYIKGVGGVRIEDMVVVTDTGCIDLTNMPKNLVI
ncbi:Xaa-Pro peptidase family protein [Methanocella sp.]|uniref:Xaa-Pro peptidase family protein n=1 Tax=Methanocella sp. TaxID=2052833 RepID=UPI002D7F21EA|nr:Xaa-Pro peptidase family protein [Methanocella sp.]